MYQVVLASESPRRKEILEIMGINYRAIATNVIEVVTETEPSAMVQALAKLKTNAVILKPEVQTREYQEMIVIGADTMVFYKEHALGKPKNKEDAARMLRMLSDEVHEVYTGVNIIIRNIDGSEENISFAVCTEVVVMPLTEAQIQAYIATGEPMDKAGAYAIQGKFGIFIKGIRGDYYNVVGFPIAQIYDAILKKGIDIKKLN